MEITLATQENQTALSALWQECFGDEASTIDSFFKHSFNPQNTVICKDGEKLVSMLFLLPEQLYIREQFYKAYYVYAAATTATYRKCGIMGKLLAFAKGLCIKRNIPFLFLTPANSHLFDYYAKHGFVPAFRQNEVCVDRTVLESLASNLENISVSTQTAQELESIQVKAFQDISFVQWRANELELARDFADDFVSSEYGFYISDHDGDTEIVYEFCADKEHLPSFLRLLLQQSSAKHFKLMLPADISVIGATHEERKDRGMILACKDTPLFLEHSNIYMGITLG